MNNLLLGKSAIVSSRGRRLGPPPGAIPPSRQTTSLAEITSQRHSRITNDTISWEEEKHRKSQNRRNSVKWKDIKKEKAVETGRKTSIDLEEAGDGIIVSELEANAMIASMRSRSSSETSSYSSRSESSTDTSLCDENEKASDSEQDIPIDDKENNKSNTKNKKQLPKSNSPECKNVKSSPLSVSKIPSIDCSSSKQDKKINKADINVNNISEYLDSAAGESLRVYIDGFELKLKEPHNESNKNKDKNMASPLKCMRHHRLIYDKKFHKPEYDERKNCKKTNISKSNTLTDYSPINSPRHCAIELNKFYKELPYKQYPTSKLQKNSRPPDIIDSFVMNPNFVTDIDLSEGLIPDTESPIKSPGSDSVIISEDEPPIPLKIDKYFEHSPEFFGARLSDPNNSDIPSRRPTKRNSRLPKKPDSLTLQSNNNEKNIKTEVERASSLPQSHSFVCRKSVSPGLNEEKSTEAQTKDVKENKKYNNGKRLPVSKNEPFIEDILTDSDTASTKEYILRSGRKNSERALQIIQENSQILSRILTKQNITSVNNPLQESLEDSVNKSFKDNFNCSKNVETKLLNTSLLKESTSDSLIGCLKRIPKEITSDKSDILKVRPISIDDPFSLDIRNVATGSNEFSFKNIKTPSIECLGNKTDLYGWENKGFFAKCDYKNNLSRNDHINNDYKKTDNDISISSDHHHKNMRPISDEWSRYSLSSESKISVTLPSSENKDTSTYERRLTSDDYNYPQSNSTKYNELLLLKTSDVCSKTLDQSPKTCENFLKTDNSSFSDFSQKVTSSISFTCDPSVDDDSPMGAKSNSSDTLCQITSLDQVSTPISPKVFPNRDTTTLSRDSMEISDKVKIEHDDTCSTITSLLDTDTLSSLSFPRSPSTGSYHPFPTRPPIRLPKEIGVKLGMYPKEAINSPQK